MTIKDRELMMMSHLFVRWSKADNTQSYLLVRWSKTWIILRSGREVELEPTTEPLNVMDLGIMRTWCFRSESKGGFWTNYEKNNDYLCVDSDDGDESTRTFTNVEGA